LWEAAPLPKIKIRVGEARPEINFGPKARFKKGGFSFTVRPLVKIKIRVGEARPEINFGPNS
jgi:hypothetical protein